MATDQALHMSSGVGETSYTNNSSLQRKVILKVKPILEESVKRMLYCTNFESPLKVADLGCSSGPNALMVVSGIINIINNTVHNMNQEPPVLQVYLNDLFGNDFNTIFMLLPDFYHRMQQERGDRVGACFINATPGNFYGRLFPNNYIHFFHSSYCLHWLSQAPKDLSNGTEPLNKGKVYVTSTKPPAVYKAYLEQFKRDFKLFLKSRFEELRPGGSMVLTFIGREKADKIDNPCVLLGTVLKGMVLQGLVEEAKLDFFNVPIYGPTAEEVKEVIEAEGSLTLQTLNTFKMGWDANLQEDVNDFAADSEMRGQFVAKSIRAVFEPLLSAEFGEEIIDELFTRYAKEVTRLIEFETLEYTNLVVYLTKGP